MTNVIHLDEAEMILDEAERKEDKFYDVMSSVRAQMREFLINDHSIEEDLELAKWCAKELNQAVREYLKP